MDDYRLWQRFMAYGYVLVVQVDGSMKHVEAASSTIVNDRVVVPGDLKQSDCLTTSQKRSREAGVPFVRGN